MEIFVRLTTAGVNTGPDFTLFADMPLPAFSVAFAANVPKATLLAGATYNVHDDATQILIRNVGGVCEEDLTLDIVMCTTTTTSTTGEPTTTTTSTTIEPVATTTTTTTAGLIAIAADGPDANYEAVTSCFNPTLYTFYTNAAGLIIATGDNIYTTNDITAPATQGWYFMEDLNGVVRRFEIGLTGGEVITIAAC